MEGKMDWTGLGPVSAEMTDKLPAKLDAIGKRLTELMNDSNRNPDTTAAYEAEDRIDGILFVLSTLGIPHEVRQQGEVDWYTSVDIAGRTFYVSGGGKMDNEKEGSGRLG
ncbi:MAG: hypothetical protein IJT94_16280 [Oscillibacter sp.]|nr:hypothetical protein [Oscillibacter sp.]